MSRLSKPSHAWLAVAILLAGALVFLPAVRAPLWLDDYVQASMVDGSFPAARGPTGLYDFVGDDDRKALMDRGILPWWSNPRLKVRFFRPLSSALLFAEHRLTSHAPLPLHLASLAWWAAAVLAARSLYRRVLPERASTLAMAVFALAPCHALPLAWVANREVLMSLAFGAAALGLLARSRTAPTWGGFLGATALFSLSLASGEYGVCFGGYVLAFELSRPGSRWKKLPGLLAFALPAAAYLSVRAALHYGAAGSGFYHDPLRTPGAFLQAAPRRLITLLADGWLTANADDWASEAPLWLLAALLACALLFFARPLRTAMRAAGAPAQRDLRWLAAGSLLALVPVLAAAPSSRLIAVSVLGTAPLVAALIDHAWLSGAASVLPDQRLRLAAIALGFLHLVHGPAISWFTSRALQATSVESAASARWLRDRIGDTSAAGVVVTRAAWQSVGPLAVDPPRVPARWRVLVIARHALALRTNDRTLEVVIPRGEGFYPAGSNDLFRSDDDPIRTGDEVDVPGMHVTVVDAGISGPARMRFVFDRSLDDPSLTWVAQTAATYKSSSPPGVGFGARLDP